MTGHRDAQRDVQLKDEDFPSPESTDPGSHDHWLDEVTEPSNPVFNPATQFALSTFSGPVRLLRRIWNFMTTTPGRMFAITVALSVALAAALCVGRHTDPGMTLKHRDLTV